MSRGYIFFRGENSSQTVKIRALLKHKAMITLIENGAKMLTYTNKKNKIVKLSVSRHAYNQFIVRYKKAYPDSILLDKNVADTLEKIFNKTNQVKNLNRKEKIRLKRHGEDTMFFRTNYFTFVVQNAEIVTVELSDKNMRHLN